MSFEPIKDQYTKVSIKLNDYSFIAGQQLSGTVLITTIIDKPYTCLTLRLTCYQYYLNKQTSFKSLFNSSSIQKSSQTSEKFKQTDNGDDFLNQRKNLKKNIYFDEKVKVKNFESLTQGQYNFPFVMCLPQNLPASLFYEDQYLSTKIFYQLSAILSGNNGPSKNFIHSQVINISENPKKMIYNQYNDKIFSPKSFFCLSSIEQSIRINFKISQCYLSPNSQFSLHGKIDTRDCCQDLKGLQVVLIRKVMVKEKTRVNCINTKQWILWQGFNKISRGVLMPFNLNLNTPNDVQYASTDGSLVGVFYGIILKINCKNFYEQNEVKTQICMHIYQNNKLFLQNDLKKSAKSAKSFLLNRYPENKKLLAQMNGMRPYDCDQF